jgi:hypothetical protein
MFRNKSAYPVYMTIGNLPKDIRRKPSHHGHILLGYLPTTRLEHMTNKAGRRRAIANLFHASMRQILKPLRQAGIEGVKMASGDGVTQRCHPILAMFVGDYPEQTLVACCKNNQCPKCTVPPDELEVDGLYPLRNLDEVLNALETLEEGPTAYARACDNAGIKPVFHPFWEDLPYVNIFRAITPDILHQMYQGVLKHVIAWLQEAFDTAEIDARCNRLPPNHNLRLFRKGICTLSRVSGKEHSDMCRIILGLIIDIRLPNNQSPARLIRAVRSILDFLYIAQYPSHTDETLAQLNDALARFHENKSIFIDLAIRTNFNIPKLHSLQHYTPSIELFGTTDNYNTEYSERLHIDLAKDAYRATNHKDEYPQMTRWLERKEKVLRHDLYIKWRCSGQPMPPKELVPPPLHTHVKMTHHPTVKAVPLDKIVLDYGATNFRHTLAVFIASHNHPGLTRVQLQNSA